MVGGQVLLAYHSSAPTPVAFQSSFEAVQGQSGKPVSLNNGLRFDLRLQPKETRSIDFIVAGSSRLYPAAERERLAAVDCEQSLLRAESYWDHLLQPGMKLTTPEPKLNDIYKHLVLSSLANMRRDSNTAWIRPNHHFLQPDWIWPWEFAEVSVALDSLGYHKDMESCLQYFIEHQSGVGSRGKDIGPEGDVKSTRGCFVGTLFRWMCNTGVVLSPMAGHYRYSRNAEWLKAARPSILAAWDWVQREREATRTLTADGKKVAHYGLLPKGRVHDWEGHRYHYTFSDAFTYKGMADIATAFGRRACRKPTALRRKPTNIASASSTPCIRPSSPIPIRGCSLCPIPCTFAKTSAAEYGGSTGRYPCLPPMC